MNALVLSLLLLLGIIVDDDSKRSEAKSPESDDEKLN